MTTNVTPNKAVGNVIPAGVVKVDPVSGIASTVPHAKYTQITTSGTTTVSAGPCVYVSANVYVLATSTDVITILDGTNTLASTTPSAAGNQAALQPTNSTGIRCLTSLVVVTTGTAANSYNVFWD